MTTRASALIPVAAVLHWTEELPRFPRWEARHFPEAGTTLHYLVISHIPLLVLFLVVAYLGWRSRPAGFGIQAVVAVHAAFLVNVLFQLGCTLAFWEYVPGNVTCAAVFVPFAAWHYHRILADGYLQPRAFALAAGAGAIVSALLSVWVLYGWGVL